MAKPPRWSHPTGRCPRACWRRSRAGRCPSTTRAPISSAIPAPVSSRASLRKSRSALPSPCRCSLCSSTRCCGSPPPPPPPCATRPDPARARAVLRGPRPKTGIAGLLHALATFRAERDSLHPRDPRRLVSNGDLAAAEALVKALGEALAPLTAASSSLPLARFAERHRDCVIRLGSDATNESVVFTGKDGEARAPALRQAVNAHAANELKVSADDYPELFHAALAARIVRMREQEGVRIRIFGPLEARLQLIDLIVLGGLNEATWPPDGATNT